MNWQSFKQTLYAHPHLALQFKYGQDKLVDAAYHITEIKQCPVTSVDCGGVVNRWTEVIIQLWVAGTEKADRAMSVSKALSIIELVEKVLPLEADAIVKIEYGDWHFDTRQMLPYSVIITKDELVVDLQADTVQCKATERGGSCGVNDKGEECCPPAGSKPKFELKNLTVAQTACAPGSGCC